MKWYQGWKLAFIKTTTFELLLEEIRLYIWFNSQISILGTNWPWNYFAFRKTPCWTLTSPDKTNINLRRVKRMVPFYEYEKQYKRWMTIMPPLHNICWTFVWKSSAWVLGSCSFSSALNKWNESISRSGKRINTGKVCSVWMFNILELIAKSVFSCKTTNTMPVPSQINMPERRE